MIRFLAGLVVGFVLGARAGRDRYDQIVRLASRTVDNPAVRAAAGAVRGTVSRVVTGGKKDGKKERGKKEQDRRPDPAYLDVEDGPVPVTPTSMG